MPKVDIDALAFTGGTGYPAPFRAVVDGRTRKRLGEVPKSTRGWDETQGITWPQRSKEESSDYRYFPDPDLVPVTVTD